MKNKKYRDIIIGALLALVLAVYPLLSLVDVSSENTYDKEESQLTDFFTVTEKPVPTYTAYEELENTKPEQKPPEEPKVTAIAKDYSESGGFRYVVEDGKAKIIYYSGFVESVTVPAVLDGIPVDEISENAFSDKGYAVKEITISEGIRIIENNFNSCRALRRINLPKSLEFISPECFADGQYLSEINIPENDYYKSVDGVLFSADGRKLVKVPNAIFGKIESDNYIISEHVKVIGAYSCRDISSGYGETVIITVPDGVTDIESFAFESADCAVKIPGSVERVGYKIFGDELYKMASADFYEGKFPSLNIYSEDMLFKADGEAPIDHALRLAKYFMDNNWSGGGFYLMDFDLDGIPELIQSECGMNDYYASVYNLKGDLPESMLVYENGGTYNGFQISFGGYEPLRLYYDKEEDRYFYAIYGGIGGMGIWEQELNKITPCGGKLVLETIGYQSGISDGYDDENYKMLILYQRMDGEVFGPIGEMLNSYTGFEEAGEEYLSQFELIKTIDTSAFATNSILEEYELEACFEEAVKNLPKNPEALEFNRAPFEKTEYEKILVGGDEYNVNSSYVGIELSEENNTIDFEALSKMPNLKYLGLYVEGCDRYGTHGKSVLPVDLSGIEKLPNLTELTIDGDISFDAAPIKKLQNLKFLYLYGYSGDITFISDLKNLRVFEIIQNYYRQHTELSYLEPLYNLPNLKAVMINGQSASGLTNEQIDALMERRPDCIFSFYKY